MARMKRGTVVVLRSGGPEMVIEKIERRFRETGRYASCHWFDRVQQHKGVFAVHMLEAVTTGAGEADAAISGAGTPPAA